MCAVIGISSPKLSGEMYTKFLDTFIESKIRGLHATGISFLKGGKVHTYKEAIPADEFVNKYMLVMDDFLDNGSINLIGHCRYSTSDLLYNQPISDDDNSLVHNGVISQEPYGLWQEMYGTLCIGKNDSELLFRGSKNVFSDWVDSSIAAIELNEGIRFYRNGKRPLYFTNIDNGFIITSTEDIIRRGIPDSKPIKTEAGVIYTIYNYELSEERKVIINDIQP